MPAPGSLNLVADPELNAAGAQLEDRLRRWADRIEVRDFIELMEPLAQRVLNGAFQWVGAAEGTVWLAQADREVMVAAFNTGPQASDLVGFEQSLDQGIISLVFANEQAYCENEITGGQASHHDATLDRKLGKETAAMIAVPFYFGFGLRGVISCVQLRDAQTDDNPPGFSSRHVEELANTATLVERLIDTRLIMASLGLDHV